MSDGVVDLLCDLVAIPSVNPMGREVEGVEYFETRMTEYLVRFFRELGVPCEVQEVMPGRSNVFARFDAPAGGAAPTLLLDAHQDTVPVDGMTIPPFEPSVRDGRVYGRGSCDVKGGMAAMLHAFRRLVHERPERACHVILSCTCDEESTAQGIRALSRYWGDLSGQSKLITARPAAAIIAEPTLLDVVVAHRGASRFRIRTRGRACHSSDPSQGINAIYRMARLVSALEDYAAELPSKVPPHPRCGGASLSVGRITGGSSVNIVPDDCVIEIDRRVVPGEDCEAVIEDIRSFLKSRLDFDFEFEPPWLDGATLNDLDNGPLADSLLRVIQNVDGPHQAVGVPYGTHASRTSATGVPSVVFGPGSIAQAHTKDEWLEIAQLEKAAEVYFQFCRQGADLRL
jgi:acetylornithine deacetylase